MCCKSARRKIMSAINERAYDEIYLLFRTNKVLISSVSSHYISGYYDVDLNKSSVDPDYEEPVIYAKKAKFVNLENAVDISDFLQKSRNYRFPFSNETENGAYSKYLNYCRKKIESSQNLLNDYVSVTEELNKIFKYNEFNEGPYGICKDCENDKCLLLKRIRIKGKLLHQLSRDVADKIHRYYKETTKLH